MVGGLARVAKDIPPYMLVKGDSNVWAVNSVGLRRGNFSHQRRSEIKAAFKLLYRSGLNVKQATEQLRKSFDSEDIRYLINFILHSQRGICAEKRLALWERIRLGFPAARRTQIPAYRLFQDNRKGQEPLAFALLLVLIILLLIFFKRPLWENLQDKYRNLIGRIQNSSVF